MFYYLNGKIAILDENLAVIDCGGIGYGCRVTNYTLSQLHVGDMVRLYTHCDIREDAFDIYGFFSREEQRCFELLLRVTGVGPKAAVAILSVMTPEQFTLAVMTGDDKSITMAQGVGKKIAQRIVLELKDKIGSGIASVDFSSSGSPLPVQNNKVSLATAALAELGYGQSEIAAALKGVDAESMTTEEIVRRALRSMVMGG